MLIYCRSFKGQRLLEGDVQNRETPISQKRRVIHMKFRNFVIVSFQITVNNNHYDIRDKVFMSGLSKFCGRQTLTRDMVCLKFFKGCLPQNLLSPLLNTLSHILYIPDLLVICIASMFSYLLHMHFILLLD